MLCCMALMLLSCGNKKKSDYNISDEERATRIGDCLDKVNEKLPLAVDGLGEMIEARYEEKRKTMVIA